MTRYYRGGGLGAIAVLGLFLTACIGSVSDAERDSAALPADAAGHVAAKPGARVSLADATPLEITPGEVSPVTLRLAAEYQDGHMEVSVAAGQDLEIVSEPSQFSFDLAPDTRYGLPLDILAAWPGRYYLNLHIQVNSGGGETETRALAVIVKAGDAALREPSMAPPEKTSGGDKVHSLPARERIEEQSRRH